MPYHTRSDRLTWNPGKGEVTGRNPSPHRRVFSPGRGSPTRGGLRAIRAWRGLADRSRYAASWEAVAPPLRDTVDAAGWILALRTSRAPLGRCLWRRPAETSSLTDPAAEQAFAVVRFTSRFEAAEGVEETVAATRHADGRWRIAGYFIGTSDVPARPATARGGAARARTCCAPSPERVL